MGLYSGDLIVIELFANEIWGFIFRRDYLGESSRKVMVIFVKFEI